MTDENAKNFYKDQYFDGLNTRLASIEESLNEAKKDLADIKGKVVYMYGFAAAIGLVASFFIDWVRTSMTGITH